MIRATGGYRAHELERISAATGGGGGSDLVGTKLYALEGEYGFWRRVKDPKVSDPAAQGVVVAFAPSGILYLRPAAAETAELSEAGWTHSEDGATWEHQMSDVPPRADAGEVPPCLFREMLAAGKAFADRQTLPTAAPSPAKPAEPPAAEPVLQSTDPPPGEPAAEPEVVF